MIEFSAFAWTNIKLFGGVAGVLLLASAIGALLKWRVALSTITNLDGLCGRFDQAERWTVEDLPQRP